MHNVVQQYLAANNILFMRKGNRAFLLLAIALAWKWQIASLPKDIRQKNKLGDQLNDKTIIEFGYRKISWFVSVSLARDKCFAQPCPIIVNYFTSKLRFPNFPLNTLRNVNCRTSRGKLFYNTLPL